MVLTDTRIRNAKPKAKSYKLSDGGGMYLLVKPDGARYWRLDYRFAGKRRTLALGVYPTTTLSKARSRREEARALLAPSVLQDSQSKIRLRRSHGSALPSSAIDWLPVISIFSLPDLRRISSRKSAHGLLPRLMRLSCWKCSGRLKSAG
jgi:Arm domain-containing DNA-binding protein